MPTVIQVKRGTASSWTSANTVLAAGEMGFETDTKKMKVGDGSTAWTSLGYTATDGDISGVTAGTGLSGGGTSGAVTLTNSMATEITAKADLIVGTGNATFDNLPVGANGTVLTADSSVSPTGLKWSTPAAGSKVLQVVYAESTSDVSISTTTPTDSGNSATITPTSATSKILVLTTQIHELKTTTTNANMYGGLRIVRGTTSLQTTNQDGAFQLNLPSSGSLTMRTCTVMNYLDSPATTSATTYKTQAFCDPTYTIRFGFDNAYSSITLMEIGA